MAVQNLIKNDGTPARRRLYLLLVDDTDGKTPETGEAGGQPQISMNGGSFSNTVNTLVAIGNGSYYVELTAAEENTDGRGIVRYKSANTREFQDVYFVQTTDIHDPYTNFIYRKEEEILANLAHKEERIAAMRPGVAPPGV
jgi:hypothetical protein